MKLKDAIEEYRLYLNVEKNASRNTIESYLSDLSNFQSYLKPSTSLLLMTLQGTISIHISRI